MMSYSSAPRSLLLAGAFSVHSHLRRRAAAAPAAGRGAACRRARASTGLAFDRTARGQRGRRQAGAGRAAADCGGAGQTSGCRTQGAGGLQHRGLCRRHGECAFARPRRQGHGVRRQPPLDKVYAIVNKDGKRSVKVIASGLYRPNGVAFKDGTLYIAELSKVSKIDKVEDNLDNPPKPTVIYDNLPKDEAHGWKFIAIGPDNKLYVPVGQPGNNVLHDDDHGQIRRMNLDGAAPNDRPRRPQYRRLRLESGDQAALFHRQRPRLDVGRRPEDELNRVTKVGEHFGAPYCLQGNIVDPEFGWGKSCSDFTAPVGLLGPHSASLGMRFYTGSMFPKAYKNAPSSPGTARGTGRRKSAATLLSPG